MGRVAHLSKGRVVCVEDRSGRGDGRLCGSFSSDTGAAIQYSIESDRLKFTLEIQNRGVAPFYYDWKGTYGLISKGRVLKKQGASGKLTGILPDEKPKVWSDEMDLRELPKGSYTLAIGVPNTLPNGLPLRFANADQDRNLDGLLSLITFER